MKFLALSSLYRQSLSVILGIAGLLVMLGVEVCVPLLVRKAESAPDPVKRFR